MTEEASGLGACSFLLDAVRSRCRKMRIVIFSRAAAEMSVEPNIRKSLNRCCSRRCQAASCLQYALMPPKPTSMVACTITAI